MSRRRTFAGALLALVLATAGAVAWSRAHLRGSLARLEGTYQLAGLSAAVTVERDALGIPTVRASSREDIARATGFLHAQDRFFQMDLNRRRAAGELAALVGPRALRADVEIRRHRFRAEAERALQLMAAQDRAVLDAYTAGVNSGLRALASPPFEYTLLRQDPQPWRAEDSLLVVLTMFITLQDSKGSYESTLGTMHDVLPAPLFAFLVSPGTEWDAPVVGERFRVPEIPGPEVYDLRVKRKLPTANSQLSNMRSSKQHDSEWGVGNWELGVIGSNNWVVSGSLTADGHPLLANDMHLDVRVPNTWYRAMFEWPGQRVVGLTLPGYPSLVAGSNTHVAWGFTNTYADWGDLIVLDTDPDNPMRYRTPEGWRTFEEYDEIIKVAGEADRHERVQWTMWGPVIDVDHLGRLRAFKWVAHAADRLAGSTTPIESARSIVEAFDQANGLGAPGQNIVAADRDGHIGWSVYGAIPRRVGIDGSLPSSWSDGTRGWREWLSTSEYPRIIDPPGGRIWTANARVVDGDMLAKLGDGSYEVGSRASIIRDRLAEKDRFTPADMLDIQLDSRGVFLSRWRDVILETLTPGAVAGHRDRARFRDLVTRTWDGHATPKSVAYRFTRMFREEVSEAVMTSLLADCYEADVNFDHTTLRRREGPIWKLVTERPLHLLGPQYSSWDELLVAAVDDVIARAREGGSDLSDRTWSEYDVTAFRHPLSAAVPLFGNWLNIPTRPLPGDLFTVRMHWGAATASERLVVSPGEEEKGILHMPTGQSGNPLSPFYSNSHDAWVRGDATPLLPGKAEYVLRLKP